MRDEGDREGLLRQFGDGQGDAVERDRALLRAVAEDIRRRLDEDAQPFPFRLHRLHATDGVHVSLDVVAAERVADAERRLDVHLCAERLHAPERLRDDVEREPAPFARDDGQADPVDRDRVAELARTDVSTTSRAPSKETTRPTSRTIPVNMVEPYLRLVHVRAQQDVVADEARLEPGELDRGG